MQVDLSRSKTRWPWSVKLRRGIWTFVLEPLVRWLPKVCSPMRVAALRLMGAHIGHRCLVMPGVRVLMPWQLSMGVWSALGEAVNVYNFAPIHIGSHTVVSQFSYLCTGSHDYTREEMPLIHAPIDIGAQAWIAADVFIGPGVCIPDGAVIAARSVVTKSLPDKWAVYGGHPCRWIKPRLRPLPTSQ